MIPGETTGRWVRNYHPSPGPGAPVRLVCFPHAGGAATYFRPLSRALQAEAEVLAVQYPGRQDRRSEPMIDRIPDAAERIADEVGGLTDRPLALLGHSMGAVVAFEVARRLEARPDAATPVMLFASGRRSPVYDTARSFHLADDAALLDELRLLSGTDLTFLADEEMRDMILPPLRNDYRALEDYRYPADALVGCPVVALVGDADPRTSIGEAAAWAGVTTGAFGLRVFPGGHFYLTEKLADVVGEIRARLARFR
jgi:surfactin synthase thioesterase subunit